MVVERLVFVHEEPAQVIVKVTVIPSALSQSSIFLLFRIWLVGHSNGRESVVDIVRLRVSDGTGDAYRSAGIQTLCNV